MKKVEDALGVLETFIREARACMSAHEPATKHDIARMEERIMSKITDETAIIQANLDTVNAKLDSLATGIADLDTLITNLQNSPGTLSAADQAALDAIQAMSAALAAKATALDATPPGTTTTTTTPAPVA